MTVTIGHDGLARCSWSAGDELYRRYHDEEWGVPLHGDRQLFEKLSLEAFQAGLSWITILKRRDGFREAFSHFDIAAVAALTPAAVDELMTDARIVRNRAKIEATVANARIAVDLTAGSPGALDALMWSFAPSHRARPDVVPTATAESTAMSTALRKLGFRFVGPTTMYALMQATGMVDDHEPDCWRASTAPR